MYFLSKVVRKINTAALVPFGKNGYESIETTFVHEKTFVHGDAHPSERRVVAEVNRVRKPCLALRVHCGEDGVGRRNIG